MPTQTSSREIEWDDAGVEAGSVRRQAPSARKSETQSRDSDAEDLHHHADAGAEFVDPEGVAMEVEAEEADQELPPEDGESSLWKPDDLQPGTRLTQELEVKEKLVDGGMSVIYLAEHARFGQVVVKVMKPKKRLAENPEKEELERRRFLREIAVLKRKSPNAKPGREQYRLNHPDVIEVLECGVTGPDGQGLYLVTPYCEEGDLSSLEDNFAMASPERLLPLLKMLRDPVRALAAMHKNRMVHLDFKPGNILLRTVNGLLKALLADFGLIKRIDSKERAEAKAKARAEEEAKAKDREKTSEKPEAISKASHVVGTAPFVSPEQVDDLPENIGPWCDAFSLGVTLYHLLTGGEGIFGDASFDKDGELDFEAHCEEMKAFKKGERGISDIQEVRKKKDLEPLSPLLAADVMKLLALDRKVRMPEALDVIYDRILAEYRLFLQARAMKAEAEHAEDMADEKPKSPSVHSGHNEYEPGQRITIVITRKIEARKGEAFEKISKQVIVREKLGEGGMSKVYRVEMDGQDFALKIIAFADSDLQRQLQDLDADNALLQFFPEEARLEAEVGNQKRRTELSKDRETLVKQRKKLQRREQAILEMISRPENRAHPHLMRIEAAGEIEGDHEERACVLMPYCEQGDLTSKMKKVEGMSEEEELAFFQSLVPVAEALEWLHAKKPQGSIQRNQGGILSRDVKPENILFDGEGHAILSDLGLARRNMNDSAQVKGTAVYSAPEQMLDNPATPKSDVFSFGATLYYALSGGKSHLGELPSDGMRQAGLSLSYAMRARPLAPLDRARENYKPASPLPAEMILFVRRCLDPNSLYRPEALSQEFQQALQAWQQQIQQRKQRSAQQRASRGTSVGSRAA